MNRIGICLAMLRTDHRLTMIWQKKHRVGNPVDEVWEYDAWKIPDSEDLKEKIAYVLRNPTVARMGFVPGGYRWSSASLVFTDTAGQKTGGRRMGTLSSYESRNMFQTRTILPEDWIVQPDGMIWPGCYTGYQRVEKLFGHPQHFLYSLNQNVEMAVNQQMYRETISLPDQDVRQMAKALSKKLFDEAEITALDLPCRIQLCRLLKKQAGASLKQLARIVHLPLAELKKIFC